MAFKKQVQAANQSGSKQVTIPYDVTGPNGEDIEVGDEVVFEVLAVEKQGDSAE